MVMKKHRAVVMVGGFLLFSHTTHAMLRKAVSLLPVVGGYLAPVYNGGVVAECDTLQSACAKGTSDDREEALQALRNAVLVSKKDVNGTDQYGQSGLLILGKYMGNQATRTVPRKELVEAVQFLLARGADGKTLYFGGFKCNLLHQAAQNGYYTLVVDLVHSAGLDVNAVNDEEETSLLRAASNASWCKKRQRGDILAFMNQLIVLNADVNKKCVDGYSPLHWADTRETIELLIANRADVEAVNKKGETPLHIAAVAGATEQLQTLLAHGANIHAQDAHGRTPLQVAQQEPVSYSHTQEVKQQIIQLLTQAGGCVGVVEGEEKSDERAEASDENNEPMQ